MALKANGRQPRPQAAREVTSLPRAGRRLSSFQSRSGKLRDKKEFYFTAFPLICQSFSRHFAKIFPSHRQRRQNRRQGARPCRRLRYALDQRFLWTGYRATPLRNRYMMVFACPQVREPRGESVLAVVPVISPVAQHQAMAGTAMERICPASR